MTWPMRIERAAERRAEMVVTAQTCHTQVSSRCLRPHRRPVNLKLLRDFLHADAVLAGCSHRVHFAVREPRSRSFTWFRRRGDQRIIRLVLGVGMVVNPLIPCGNELLNPRSSVPALLNCVHRAQTSSSDHEVQVLSVKVLPSALQEIWAQRVS